MTKLHRPAFLLLAESFYRHYHRNQQYNCFDDATLLCFNESDEFFLFSCPNKLFLSAVPVDEELTAAGPLLDRVRLE